MGALRFFRRTGEGVYDMEDLEARTEAMAGFIEAERGLTGAPRVVGLGYSNGANILASVMLAHPGLVDDAILMHPLIPWEPEPQPGLDGRRVLITAGERGPDRTCTADPGPRRLPRPTGCPGRDRLAPRRARDPGRGARRDPEFFGAGIGLNTEGVHAWTPSQIIVLYTDSANSLAWTCRGTPP